MSTDTPDTPPVDPPADPPTDLPVDAPNDAPNDAPDTDGEKGGTDLERAQRAAAAANRRIRELERAQNAEKDKADKEAGRWKEIAERRERELDELRTEHTTTQRRTLAEKALGDLQPAVKNVGRLVAMLDLDAIEDDKDAEREAKRLKREEPDLFRSGTRQVRDAGRNGNARNDDDDDKRPTGPQPIGVDRIRAALERDEKARAG